MMKMPWEDDINWGNTATTLGKENDMVVTATESGLSYKIQTEQDRLIEELTNRVTSLEDAVDSILEQLTTRQTGKCDDCIYVEGSQWCEKCDGESKHWAKGE